MTEPTWLSVEEAVAINFEEVSATGEDHALRDRGLLESAIDRARNRYAYGEEQDIGRLAVCLLLGIAQNHPFVQGNKRTGFTAALQFLRLNGYVWAGPNDRAIADSIVAAITGDLTEDQLFETLRPHIRPL